MPDDDDEQISIDDVLNPKVDRHLRRLPGLIRDAIKLVWNAGRKPLTVVMVLQAIGGVGLAVQLLAGRRLLVALLATRTGGSFDAAVPDVIALSAAVAVVSAANVIRFELQQLLGELVSRHAMQLIVAKAGEADLLKFESSSYHDRLQRALYNGSSRPLQLTTGLISLGGSLFGVVAVGLTLLIIQPLFLGLALVAIIPIGLATMLAGRAFYRFGFRQTARDRRRLYLQYLLTQRDAAKEIRAYSLAPYLQARYQELYAGRIDDLRGLIRRRGRQGLVGSVATSILSGGSLGLLIWFVASKRLSLAGAGAAAAGLLLFGNQLQSLVSGVGAIYESSLFVQDFLGFVKEEPQESEVEPPLPVPTRWSVLRADKVSFHYPRQSQAALSKVSVTIHSGEVVALVGENGSGKSTLAKVIAGLYPTAEGSVLWDGIDISRLDQSQLRAQVAMLFQDFVRYQMTVLENITMGDSERRDQREVALRAARQAGAEQVVNDLPEGWDTQLGPQFFGGVDLSGGQWQRVALARALFRDASLVILDEPTASLDPRSEAELFGGVRKLFAGRSLLLITHRFTSARLADRIYVLQRGRVVEEGTHADLLDRGGLYAELFWLQEAAINGAAGERHSPGGPGLPLASRFGGPPLENA